MASPQAQDQALPTSPTQSSHSTTSSVARARVLAGLGLTDYEDELPVTWAKGTLPDAPTALDRNGFVVYQMSLWRNNIMDDDLVEAFRYTFGNWTVKNWKQVNPAIRMALRTILREQGVLVAIKTGLQTDTALQEAAVSNTNKWEQADITRQHQSPNKGFHDECRLSRGYTQRQRLKDLAIAEEEERQRLDILAAEARVSQLRQNSPAQLQNVTPRPRTMAPAIPSLAAAARIQERFPSMSSRLNVRQSAALRKEAAGPIALPGPTPDVMSPLRDAGGLFDTRSPQQGFAQPATHQAEDDDSDIDDAPMQRRSQHVIEEEDNLPAYHPPAMAPRDPDYVPPQERSQFQPRQHNPFGNHPRIGDRRQPPVNGRNMHQTFGAPPVIDNHHNNGQLHSRPLLPQAQAQQAQHRSLPRQIPPQMPHNDDNRQSARAISDIMKIYGNDDSKKYSGDNFDHIAMKYAIFADNCYKLGVTLEDQPKAFSSMLTGRALDHYYRVIMPGPRMTINQMVATIKTQFETAEVAQSYITQWSAVNLASTMRNNPDKTKVACFNIMLDELYRIQPGLPDRFQGELALRDQILIAVKSVEACRMALFHPSQSLAGLCADIRMSLDLQAPVNTPVNPVFLQQEQYWTDRKFQRNGKRYSPRNDQAKSVKKVAVKGPGTCYICKKEGCRSYNHSQEEQDKQKAEYKKSMQAKEDENYAAFLQEFEGATTLSNDITTSDEESDDTSQ